MSTLAGPQYCPSATELDDLELLGSGAFSPVTRFNEPGSRITLDLPDDVAAAASEAGQVVLVDPEGVPLARVTIAGGEGGWPVEVLSRPQYGPFRRLYLTCEQVRGQYAGRTFVPVSDALTDTQVREVHGLGPVVLLVLVGHGTPHLSATAVLRASLLIADVVDAVVVAVPLAAHGDPEVDRRLTGHVVSNYAGSDPVASLGPGGDLPLELVEIVERDQPGPADRGLVIFFTGLSGSGKSTLARALMDRILERGQRSLTSLDGDVVRRNLSAGLSFSKVDRETNIRRIGWVAAEISRHGGVAVCSPIAPFDETRQQVRAMVEDAGGAFFLVHVATPLEECERRDRKGLYAKARAGEIPDFTGISSPYEEPEDADVHVDTTDRTIDAALDDVLVALRATGHLDLTDPRGGSTALDDPPPAVGNASEVEPPPVVDLVETPTTPPLKVLFVCTANICRSPYMELTARHLAGPDASVVFASAGTHGFREHPMDAVMATTLEPRGIEPTGFLSRPLTRELVAEHDLVLTAESTHRTFILDDHPDAFRRVFTLGQFAEAVNLLGGSLSGRELVHAVGTRRGGATTALDVGDPYGRGPEAAETSAQRIDDLLRVVVPALTGTGRISA